MGGEAGEDGAGGGKGGGAGERFLAGGSNQLPSVDRAGMGRWGWGESASGEMEVWQRRERGETGMCGRDGGIPTVEVEGPHEMLEKVAILGSLDNLNALPNLLGQGEPILGCERGFQEPLGVGLEVIGEHRSPLPPTFSLPSRAEDWIPRSSKLLGNPQSPLPSGLLEP